jgi:hypothetical protein
MFSFKYGQFLFKYDQNDQDNLNAALLFPGSTGGYVVDWKVGVEERMCSRGHLSVREWLCL